jgi:hypothetical protein
MAVTGVYGKGCMWSVGIAPVEDNETLPSWPMTWEFSGYSTVLTLDVPDDASVRLVYPDGILPVARVIPTSSTGPDSEEAAAWPESSGWVECPEDEAWLMHRKCVGDPWRYFTKSVASEASSQSRAHGSEHGW